MEDILYKGYTIKIMQDDDAMNPRDYDNVGHMVCFHRKYNLGDKHSLETSDFGGWGEMREYLVKQEKAYVILPLYLYDHSGITMNTTGFSCPWDSGQVGFIYATREDAARIFGKCYRRKKIESVLASEVSTYDAYISGNVDMFQIIHPDGEEDSWCGSFYDDEEGCIQSAKDDIDSLIGKGIKIPCAVEAG